MYTFQIMVLLCCFGLCSTSLAGELKPLCGVADEVAAHLKELKPDKPIWRGHQNGKQGESGRYMFVFEDYTWVLLFEFYPPVLPGNPETGQYKDYPDWACILSTGQMGKDEFEQATASIIQASEFNDLPTELLIESSIMPGFVKLTPPVDYSLPENKGLVLANLQMSCAPAAVMTAAVQAWADGVKLVRRTFLSAPGDGYSRLVRAYKDSSWGLFLVFFDQEYKEQWHCLVDAGQDFTPELLDEDLLVRDIEELPVQNLLEQEFPRPGFVSLTN